MAVPEAVGELVERFRAGLAEYKRETYNETQVRREFVDPLFAALGWDIQNAQGAPAGQKDVVHEDRVWVGRRQKAPDYGFYIGGARKFFVETKKPAANLHDDPAPAFQVRRYAWSAGLPVSILTDFEEFAVYDCRPEPRLSDDPYATRLVYWNFSQYPAVWDELTGRFGRAAVRDGALEQYAATLPARRGTATVDAAFLREISGWREWLAQAIAAAHPDLTPRDLNFAVQMTIDRIVFLRIGEARGIEREGGLRELAAGDAVYPRLLDAFRRADARYNSGLFHFSAERGRPESPDTLTPALTIPDDLLRRIVGRLYYPDSPYAFDVIPVEILGQVYEQFLGQVIRLEAGRAVVEDKPEVRKAGGVYYTPTYIVDYIVRHTVGPLLAGKTPAQVAELRILDPACGSGSFLIGAYGYLLDWYLAQYVAAGPARHRRVLAEAPADPERHTPAGWRLTTEERKRILLAHCFGVDIDPQAVEVTKFSLLLKVLEGLIGEAPQAGFERLLPDLGANIKCGNSLIGPDFYATGQASFLDPEEQLRINVFDWEAEFPAIMRAGGFDAVIGNPPYLNIDDTWGRRDARLSAIKAQYPHIYNDKTDILFYFLGKAVSLSKGRVAFIVSRAFLEAYKADKLRGYLASHAAIREVVDFRNFYVFPGVGITTCIITLEPHTQPDKVAVYRLLPNELPTLNLEAHLLDANAFEKIEHPQTGLTAAPWAFVSDNEAQINAKIDQQGALVGQVLAIGQGMQTGRNDVFGNLTEQQIKDWGLEPGLFHKRASNSDIQRFWIRDRGEYLLYLEDVGSFEELPLDVQRYLEEHSTELKARAAYQRGNCDWWRYTWPLHKERYNRIKILCPYLATQNRFALDAENEYLGLTDTTVLFDNGQPEDLRYLLGFLNSRLLTFRFRSIGKLKSGGILEYFWNSVSKLPIRRINFADPADRARHDALVAAVERLLALHRQAAAARTPTDKTALARQIAAADRQIDLQVYALYGLTDAEIALVEGEE